MESTSATVHDIKALSGNVWQVFLRPLEPYTYIAGQYTELLIPGFSHLYFTIASAPQFPCVELHIQGGSETNDKLIAHLKQEGSVAIAPAQGRCTLESLPSAQSPLLMIGSGTGFSQIKSIVEHLIHQNSIRPVYIYWTSYNLSHLYMLDKAEQWAEQYDHIHTAALISEHSHWEDKHQMLVHAVLADHSDDLSQCQAITCGSPEMVYTVLDTLEKEGFVADQMISDVFDFAPRDK